MPFHNIEARQIFLHEECLIIDTNLLVNAFEPSQMYHDGAREFIDGFTSMLDFIVPIEVLIESWGLIAGKFNSLGKALELFEWVSQPDNATVVYLGNDFYAAGRAISEELKVDIVDSILIHSSQWLAKTCSLSSPIPIATYEKRDYIKYVKMMHAKRKQAAERGRLILYDPLALEPSEFWF